MNSENNTSVTKYIYFLDLLGVAVFAASGALVASRKEMDIIGFGLMATLTGIGCGTLRDVLIDQSVFSIGDQIYLIVCLLIAVTGYFAAHLLQRRYIVLLWADAIRISSYGVLGAHIALESGSEVLSAITLGVMTATFGGLVKDIISRETPLILKQEVYATAALLSATCYVGLREVSGTDAVSAMAGIISGFAL